MPARKPPKKETACIGSADVGPAIVDKEGVSLPFKIGVMGDARKTTSATSRKAAFALGGAIAKAGCITVTGACPGLPLEAARGAKGQGGMVVGISPALSEWEHVHKYSSPLGYHDMLVYTGSGLMGREVVNIRTSDMVVIAGGRSGTLGEFSIAYDEGKLIGVLMGTGGVTTEIPHIVRVIRKNTGARVIYDKDPGRLITRLLSYFKRRHYMRPSCFCDDLPAE